MQYPIYLEGWNGIFYEIIPLYTYISFTYYIYHINYKYLILYESLR